MRLRWKVPDDNVNQGAYSKHIRGSAREDNAGGYRYGFNGKENDNEVKGEGNQQDYGMRVYDGRLGRFLSVDPLGWKYPMLTAYQFASNMPTKFVDLDGAEADPGEFMLLAEPPGATDDEIQGYRKGHIVVGTAKGIGNVILYTVATITQIPGAMHYGNKIPKDKWAENFPAIPNNNVVKDFIVPILTTPVELAEQLKKDPLNFELWGQAIGLFVMYKGLIPTPKYASNFREGNKILKIYNNKDVTLF